MTSSSRITKIGLLGFAVLFLSATSRAQARPPIVEQLAKTYGIDSYGQIDAVRYTFNLDLPALKVNLSRTWTWEPKTGRVTYEAKDKSGNPVKVTYLRSELSSQSDDVKNNIEPNFVNDNYWFVFPFHVYWDTSAVVTVKEKQKLPLGKGTATLVSVKYPAEVGGYTPGDTWDLFLGSDGRIKEFTYHRGGPKKPNLLSTTWAGYKKAGPLLVSTDHRGVADGQTARIFFSDVAYKLAGSDAWVNAQ
jgi:hypothetical protein